MRLLLLLLLSVAVAHAHPVAQGSLELEVRPGEIHARARISNEQVFVQTAHAETPASGLEAAWQAHGAYLLSKMEIAADGHALVGTVEKVEFPVDHSMHGFAVYELRYSVASPPHELRLLQSLMNEISFAPGNSWEATFVVRVTSAGRLVSDGALFTHREPFVVSLEAAAAPPGVFGTYLRHGIFHILEGWDHLLFMAALVLATRKIGELLAVVTAFTVAHTITLTLSVLDIVRLPSSIVEPMIALSIVVVALQNIFRPETARGWIRLGLAFSFGLFHGLGFAGGLLEAMQAGPVAVPLIAFSLGVELGHQVVVLPVFGFLYLLRAFAASPDLRERRLQWVVRLGSSAIALAGCFYLAAALRGGEGGGGG